MSDDYIPDDRPRRPSIIDSYRSLGPSKFSAIIIGVLAYAGLGLWLQAKINWPDGYGFTCRGKGCLLEDLWYSPSLLHHHNLYELGLFAWLWFLPVILIAAIGWPFLRRASGAHLSIYVKKEEQAP